MSLSAVGCKSRGCYNKPRASGFCKACEKRLGLAITADGLIFQWKTFEEMFSKSDYQVRCEFVRRSTVRELAEQLKRYG